MNSNQTKKFSVTLDSFLELGLELGLLDSIEISLGSQKIVGYARKPSAPELTSFRSSQGAEPIIKAAREAESEMEKFLDDLSKAGHLVDVPALNDVSALKSTLALSTPTKEQLEARAALARMTGQADPSSMGAGILGDIGDTPKKKRGRPKKSETADIPESQPAATLIQIPSAAPVPEKDTVDPEMSTQSQTLETWQAVPPLVYTEAPKPPVVEGMPSADENEEFRKRLTHYADDILPQAGFVPSEGIGGPRAKIKLFVTKMFPGVIDTKFMSTEQWRIFLGFFDEKVASEGAEWVVTHINESVSA